jgi:DNA-binding NarL/FixJ family response regulator
VHLVPRIRPAVLSPQELRLLRLLCEFPGFPNVKEIAFHMDITHGTAKCYLSDIYNKIGTGCIRRTVLWGIANHEALGIPLPAKTVTFPV